MIKPKIDVVTSVARTDAVTTVARQMCSGKVSNETLGKMLKALCSQHIRGLKTGKARGLVFDVEAAERAVRLVTLLVKESSPVERFIVGSMFGWHSAVGTRRAVVRLE